MRNWKRMIGGCLGMIALALAGCGGGGGSSAPATAIGNHDMLFTPAKVAGKTIVGVGSDGYWTMNFDANGTIAGTIFPDNEDYSGTWRVKIDGKIEINHSGYLDTVTITSADDTEKFWVVEDGSAIDRWYYDQTNGLEQARAQFEATTASVPAIRNYLLAANDFTEPPYVLKRWDYNSAKIPVKLNGSVVAQQALDVIETKLGHTLFDRTGVIDTLDSEIDTGLIISEGTAVGPGGVVDSNACGNVSTAPGVTEVVRFDLNSNGVMSGKAYINIGSSACSPRVDIAVHEIAHAMGLFNHFSGYGTGAVMNSTAWNVLYSLYVANTPGTTAENVIAVRKFQ